LEQGDVGVGDRQLDGMQSIESMDSRKLCD